MMTVTSVLMQPGWMSHTILSDILISGLLIVFIQLLSPIYIHFKKLKKLRSSVPSPKSHWLFGHLLSLPSTEEGLYRRAALSKRFPSLMCFNQGPFNSSVHAYHPDSVKTLLTSRAPKGYFYKLLLGRMLGEGLVNSSGKKWQSHRHLLTPAFHFDILKQHVKVFNENMPMILNWLEEKAETNEAGNIASEFSNLTFNNMTQAIMSQPANEKGEALSYIKAIQSASLVVRKRLYNPLLWNDTIYYLTPTGRKFASDCEVVHGAVHKIIKDRKEAADSSQCENVTNFDDGKTKFTFYNKKGKHIDFLDILLQTKDEDGNGLDEQSLVDEVATFFAAGQETTSNAMAWICYAFTLHQDWQEKCRQEVLDVCGVDGDIEWDQISKLHCLNLVVKESLRLYPIVLTMSRELVEPLVFKDPYDEGKSITVDKGTVVFVDIFALHRHPDFWEKPDVFDPERFSAERSKNQSSFAYLPFSASYRNCIGQNFALNQIKVVFAQILRKYRLFPSPESPPVVMEPAATLQPKHGMFIKIETL